MTRTFFALVLTTVVAGTSILGTASASGATVPSPSPRPIAHTQDAMTRRRHHRPRPTPTPTRRPRRTPTPTSNPTPTRSEVKQQIRDAWGGDDDKAIAVADCESGLNPTATSSGGTYLGLWQFSRATWQAYGGAGTDPRRVSAYDQTVVAYRLYRDRGWAPWPSCS